MLAKKHLLHCVGHWWALPNVVASLPDLSTEVVNVLLLSQISY